MPWTVRSARTSSHVAKNIRNQQYAKKQAAIFYLVTTALTLMVILALGETMTRLFSRETALPEPPPPQSINPYRPNPYVVNLRPYLFFHIPKAVYSQKIRSRLNEYQINSFGFRGPEISSQAEPGTKRLLVLGDSIVEGHGVSFEQTFSHQLGEKLGAQNWEVLNVGMQGASPLYFAANLERYLFLNPDAVLLMVHENDLYDDEMREKSYFDLPLLRDRAGLYSGGRIHSMAAYSTLLALLEKTWKNLIHTPLEQIIIKNGEVPGIHAEKKSTGNISSFAVPAAKFDQRWAMSSEYLAYAVESFRNNGVDVLMTSLCTVTQAFPAVEAYAAHCANLESHAARWARQHEVPYLSLVPTIQRAFAGNKITEVLILNDFHPTPMSHSLLADDLYPFIVTNLAENQLSR